jgi:hypothetical protein
MGIDREVAISYTISQDVADLVRRSQTPVSVQPVVTRLNAMSSGEFGMHGKEKAYGSIP